MSNKVHIGIIGCGGIANHKHLPSLAAVGEDKVVIEAFCDLIEERAVSTAAAAGRPDATIYTDYRELLADPRIDTVHICTPNVSHSEIAVAAFEAGKNVFCEKPMSHSAEQAQLMLDAWRKSGKKFTVGYQNRFRPEVQNLHTSCVNGELGKIYYGEALAVRRRQVPTWGVFPDKSKQGGGPLIDIGTHALDITLWCMGNYEVESVLGSVNYELGHLESAASGNYYGPWDTETFEVEDSAMGFIKFKNGATIVLKASWALNVLDSREASTTLCGTEMGAEIRSGASYPKDELVYNGTRHGMLTHESLSDVSAVAYFDGREEPPGVVEAKQWVEAILTDGEPVVKPEEAFRVTQILDSIYQSAASGKQVFLG